MNEGKKYALTFNCIVALSVYYVFLLIVSIAGLCYIIFLEYISDFIIEKIPLSLLGCCVTSLMGSVIYYIRKIYLISIMNNIKPANEYTKIQRWGTVLYFGVRPFFSVVITAIIVMGISAGIFTFFISDGTLSNSFVDFSMVISFFLGVSNGTLVDKLDKVGKNFVAKILD